MKLHTTIAYLGFISGFLLLITGNTLNFWLSKYGASYETIGLFSLVSVPYAFNFLWAPIFDRVKLNILPFNLHYRVKWLLILHLCGASAVFFLSFVSPVESTFLAATLAIFISFFNSSQDIVLNAYRSELTPQNKLAKTSGTYIFGYRLGMIVSGPLVIAISKYLTFQQIYLILSLVYLTFPIGILFLSSRYPEHQTRHPELQPRHPELDSGSPLTQEDPGSIKARMTNVSNSDSSLYSIFKNIGPLSVIFGLLSFLALYRIGDNFISVMINPFLLNEGFTEFQIAYYGKLCGIIGSAFGGIVASNVIDNKNLTRCLIWFGILHSFSHLSYIGIIYSGNENVALVLATIFDSVTGGMTMAAYIALISCLCKGKYRTTQYAIFSAMMGVSRTILPSIAGYIVWIGNWHIFFMISVVLIIPSLIILKSLESSIIRKIND